MVDPIKKNDVVPQEYETCTIWQEVREQLTTFTDSMYVSKYTYVAETCRCPSDDLPDSGFTGFIKSMFSNYIGHGWKDTSVKCGEKAIEKTPVVEEKTADEKETYEKRPNSFF